MQSTASTHAQLGYLGGLFLSIVIGLGADGESDTQKQLLELRKQNEILQQQVRNQQGQIDSLSQKVSALQKTEPNPASAKEAVTPEIPSAKSGFPFSLGKVRLSGEGGVPLFESQSKHWTNSARLWERRCKASKLRTERMTRSRRREEAD